MGTPERMMSGVPRLNRILIATVVALEIATACSAPSAPEITRDRAIEIARQQVSFQPDSVEAERTTSNGRAVWRVTMRGRLPGQPPGLFETAIVQIDRTTGDVVSVART
jgi:hypothetical protein